MLTTRFFPLRIALTVCGLTVLLAGCQSPLNLFRGQSPDEKTLVEIGEDEEVVEARFIRDYAVPTGLNYTKVESVALVTGLDDTGSDPPANQWRQKLIDEMQTHEVDKPNAILASPSTAMVLVSAKLPPGLQKGDRFDVEVRVPRGSETTGLRNGWLMQTRMRQYAMLGNAVQSGQVEALAQGNLLVDAVFDIERGEGSETRARVLGGGQAMKSRPLGLVVREQYNTPMTVSALVSAINQRFHHFDHGNKKGVATPKYTNYIDLVVPARYKNHVWRFIQVVRYVPVRESASERAERLKSLEIRLAEPTSAANSALQLEAIGPEGAIVLKRVLQSSRDPEVRFYAAEALAYLDESEAAEPLAEAARADRAFRWHALTALSTMDHVAAYDALSELLHVRSAETRYGAFRSMRVRNPRDPTVAGEVLEDAFILHQVDTTGEPMVHFAAYNRPEIVVFGRGLRLSPPAFLFAGKKIMVKGIDDERVKITRFEAGQDDRDLITSTDLVSVIRGIVELEGTYSDVFELLEGAKKGNYLPVRLVVDARAHQGRSYQRRLDPGAEEEAAPRFDVASPIPNLFFRHEDEADRDEDQLLDITEPAPDSDTGFFGKMTGWIRGDER